MKLDDLKQILLTSHENHCLSESEKGERIFQRLQMMISNGERPLDYRTIVYDGGYSVNVIDDYVYNDIINNKKTLLEEIILREESHTENLLNRLIGDIRSIVNASNEPFNTIEAPYITEIRKLLGQNSQKNTSSNQCTIADMTMFSSLVTGREKDSHEQKLKKAIEVFRENTNQEKVLVLIYNQFYDFSELDSQIMDLQISPYHTVSEIAQCGAYKMLILDKKGVIKRRVGQRIRIHYCDKNFSIEYLRPEKHSTIIPRLFYLAHGEDNPIYNIKKNATEVKIDDYYACHINPNSKLRNGDIRGGWKSKKSLLDKSLVKRKYNGALGHILIETTVTGPVIIINTDTLFSFTYWEEDIPFLLDYDQIAISVTDDTIGLERLSRRINDKLPRIFEEIRTDAKITPTGRRLQLTKDEIEYIILNCWKSLGKRLSGTKIGDNEYGYSNALYKEILDREPAINYYLERFCKEGYLEKASNNNYKCTKKLGKTKAALLAIMISCKLGLYEQKYTDLVEDKKTFCFDEKSSGKEVFILDGTLCSSYFDARLSLPKDTIRKNKSFAINSFQEEFYKEIRKYRRNIEPEDPLSERDTEIRSSRKKIQDLFMEITEEINQKGLWNCE